MMIILIHTLKLISLTGKKCAFFHRDYPSSEALKGKSFENILDFNLELKKLSKRA